MPTTVLRTPMPLLSALMRKIWVYFVESNNAMLPAEPA